MVRSELPGKDIRIPGDRNRLTWAGLDIDRTDRWRRLTATDTRDGHKKGETAKAVPPSTDRQGASTVSKTGNVPGRPSDRTFYVLSLSDPA